MTYPSGIRRGDGQAAVETVALVALITLLLGVVTAWAVQALPGGLGPPPVVERAARPLLAPTPPPPAPPARSAPAAGGAAPSAWRRVLRGGRDLLVLRVEAELAFGRGFVGRLRDRGAAVLRDPRVLVPRPGLGGGGAPVRPGGEVLEDLRRARRYVARLRRMPRREAWLRVTEDLGALAADQLVKRGARGLLRGAGRAAGRRVGAPGRPGALGAP